MSKKYVADISEEVMSFKTEYSDRFVYSNYFVPLKITFDDARTPLLPFYNKQKLLEVHYNGDLDLTRLQNILKDIGYPELWAKNAMDEAKERLESTLSTNPEFLKLKVSDQNSNEIGRSLIEVKDKLGVLTPKIRGANRELLTSVTEKLSETTTLLDQIKYPGRQELLLEKYVKPTILSQQELEFISGLLQSEIGFLFLDRTRIRPVGFGLGEHVYSLSLAPDEEVTLEQKTFTKKEVTFEEQNEQENQFDVELSSTYSTEIQEGFERQKSRSDSWGLTWGLGAQYASPETMYGQVNAQFNINETRNVTEAHQETMRRSVKDSQTASSKVAGKYRTQHKTMFRIVSEQSFESTSKRTIRNPNRTTPVTLHYFKVLQRLKMTQERYGARLCWAPSIKDPALTFFEKIRKGRQYIIDEAQKRLPAPPAEPPAPGTADSPTSTKNETKIFHSQIVEADKWGVTGDMRAEYEIDIPYDAEFTWDGDVSKVGINIITRREQKDVSRWIVGMPTPTLDGSGRQVLRVTVHIGAKSWLFGPGIQVQISASFYKKVTVSEQTAENTAYNDAIADYRIRLKEWEDERDAAIASANQEADAFEKRMVETLSPVNEMVSQVIEKYFPAGVRDEIWEIDYWQRLFDWERASFVAYPSWWSGGETRKPTVDPSDFINASWAKLYLPIRVGMEHHALRWIFGKSLAVPLSKEEEAKFDEVVNQLNKFRSEVIGSVDEVAHLSEEGQEAPEPYRSLATWYELMPTDGTHIEVMQGATSAADAITSKEIEDASELRKAVLEGEKLSNQLKDKAHKEMHKPSSSVHVGVGEASPNEIKQK
ncbi:hypothetical protein SAMN05877753_11147 [Bacillus oleivorans]|uniref:Uncharacterized protein n=1 Tax=Bacillus oleivorans TaxID=1448271 RepID=A0A285D5W3_9BACI|nr:hypothetical protein [Bacillus oleivorans]SNX75169.1 hypothetical protein SAMN05877753_11147 [Bacillus oleivorans]